MDMRAEFNRIMVEIELELWKKGIEYAHDGEIMFVDTAWAMGAEEELCQS